MATLDANGNVVQMPAAAVPNTRKIAGLAMNADITLAQLIAVGLCAAPESGVWTPTLYGGTATGTPTYVAQSGTYHKIGTHVTLNGAIQISAKGGMAGGLMIGGLPLWLSTCGSIKFAEGTNGLNLSAGTAYGGTARENLITIEK